MVITAKFASVCPCCNARIAVGSRVEWSKGASARHVACAGSAPVSRVSAARSAPRPTSRRPWRPCGYPGCNQSHCDECDGEGLVLTSSSGRSYRPY
jgi:hypothetical protein